MAVKLNQLNEKRLKNKRSHHCNVTEEDYKKIMPKIDILKRLSEVESTTYAVYDMHKNNYLLQSNEQKRLFGFTDESKDQDIDSEIHYQNIHPDDLSFVLETDNFVYDFFSNLPACEKKNYKLVYDFRTRNTEGNYMRYLHQMIILEQDRDGKSWLTLIISNLLSERAGKEQSHRRMINMKTGKLHLFNTIDDVSNSEIILTKRETEVLSMIGRGYDSINISDKLHISVNTVNNHRQNILRKTFTENTTQALLYAKSLGLV